MPSALSAGPGMVWVPAHGEELHFDIEHKGKVIGEMTMRFERDADQTLTMRRTQNFKAKKFLVSIQMMQQVEEVWQAGHLVRMKARTDVDTSVGDQLIEFSAQRTPDGQLLVRGVDGEKLLPGDIWPSALWHKSLLGAEHYFQPRGGRIIAMEPKEIGQETRSFGGERVVCDKIKVLTEGPEGEPAEILVWYTQTGQPCAMQLSSQMGELTYSRR
mgnify:CR=1 FL=1